MNVLFERAGKMPKVEEQQLHDSRAFESRRAVFCPIISSAFGIKQMSAVADSIGELSRDA
jgi:hypothetical protein